MLVAVKLQYRKRKLLLWISSIVFALIGLAMIPGDILHRLVPIEAPFIMAHIGAHWTLSVFLCLFLRFKRQLLGLRMRDFHVLWIAAFFSLLLGGGIEWIQVFIPERYPDWLDFYWNMGGTALGLLSFIIFRNAVRFQPTWARLRDLKHPA